MKNTIHIFAKKQQMVLTCIFHFSFFTFHLSFINYLLLAMQDTINNLNPPLVA